MSPKSLKLLKTAKNSLYFRYLPTIIVKYLEKSLKLDQNSLKIAKNSLEFRYLPTIIVKNLEKFIFTNLKN